MRPAERSWSKHVGMDGWSPGQGPAAAAAQGRGAHPRHVAEALLPRDIPQLQPDDVAVLAPDDLQREVRTCGAPQSPVSASRGRGGRGEGGTSAPMVVW